ncbi:hypothetical protein C7441_103172 [Pseudaminobacter salicylatoxidans]|uniref:Holin n=1 Tax=Pseudaminobacter salicylatoxidans TaxID=93369 RepID=A0A316C8C8_PSESE|nr:hypothetical protein [Pseudaminobacter salicylatoxidans]PWJ85316.1 hypothetical protein C7441_103172 [Pseudaminobacter salicylatoxidans]
MTENKPWYLSRTIWAALITVAAAGAGLAGLTISDTDQALLTDSILQAVAALGGIVAIIGRLAAKNRIG